MSYMTCQLEVMEMCSRLDNGSSFSRTSLTNKCVYGTKNIPTPLYKLSKLSFLIGERLGQL